MRQRVEADVENTVEESHLGKKIEGQTPSTPLSSCSQHPSSHPLTGADPQGFSPGCRLLPAPLLPSSDRGRPAGLQSWLQAAI
ncbi:unnamed protein product [Boreogadus saida]